MIENKINELIELGKNTNGFQTGDTIDDIRKVFLGWNLRHIKKELSPEEYQYFVDNSINLLGIESKFNLSVAKLTKYIKRYFYKAQPKLSQVVLNKKVTLTEEKCIEKIKEIEYAFNSFSIKIGAIRLNCGTSDFENFDVFQYDGTIEGQSDGKYVLLHKVHVPGLKLKEVNW
jgi:hypothetical protein